MFGVRFFVEYAITQVLANTISCCLMFDNRHFVLSLQQPVLMLSFLIIVKSKKQLFSSTGNAPPNDNEKQKILKKICQWFNDNIPVFIVFFGLAGDITERLRFGQLNDDINFLYWDIMTAKLHIKPPTFNTFLYLCNNQLSFIDIETVKMYNKVFFGKFFGVFIVIYMSKWLHARRQIQETSIDRIERSKNYLIEDFLDENKISMKDLLNADTDKEIKRLLKELEKCGYDYELYKRQQMLKVKPKRNEKAAFLDEVRKFKEQISELETSSTDGVKKYKLAKDEHENENQTNMQDVDEEEPNDKTDKSNESSTSNTDNKSNADDVQANADVLQTEHSIRPYYLYNVLQTFVFLIMTCFVIRIKYLLTPFLCLMASSFPPRSWFPRTQNLYWIVYICSVIFSVADTGIQVIIEVNSNLAKIVTYITLYSIYYISIRNDNIHVYICI